MTIDERIEFLEKYEEEFEKSRPFGYGYHHYELLSTCKKLKALGLEWGDNLNYKDFRIVKDTYITNSTTKYKFQDDTYYIHWDSGNVGAYLFVHGTNEYDAIQEEYKEFKDRLMQYNPVDYDDFNDHMIFDIENGKKLLNDYESIVKEIREKVKLKLKKCRLEKAKKEYEKALLEANGE